MTSSPSSRIEARSLCVDLDGSPVLENLNFTVAAGEIYALLGGNGAGKSTTLKTLLGLLQPKQGGAFIDGDPVHQSVDASRRKIAYLPENAVLYPHLSALENLQYFLSLANLQKDEAHLQNALKKVALQADAWHQPLQSYSKGMRQKTAIALAILRDAPIFLLDEPTSGLDPVAIDEFNALLSELATSGVTILMVTHDVYGACQVANRIGLLQKGELVGEFSASDGERIDTEKVHAAFAHRASK